LKAAALAARPNSWDRLTRHQPLGKKLEMKLGVSLLNRTTRQLSLTEEGERYFRRVQSVLQEMAAAETRLWRPQHAARIAAH
jgi:DNA-binding transcriptional LysR family regulator